MAKQLPKTIYVKREYDTNDPKASWLVADETPDSLEHGDAVGIYELQATRLVMVTRELK